MKLLGNGLIFLACWTLSNEFYTALIASDGSFIGNQQKFSQITSAAGIGLEVLKNGNLILTWLSINDPASPNATYYYVLFDNNGTLIQNKTILGSISSDYMTDYSLISKWPVSIAPIVECAFFALKEVSSNNIDPKNYPDSIFGIIQSFGLTPEYKIILCSVNSYHQPYAFHGFYISGAHLLHVYRTDLLEAYRNIYFLPVFLINNNLTIQAGKRLTLNTSMIYAIGNGTLTYSIMIYQYCQFELSSNPNISIT